MAASELLRPSIHGSDNISTAPRIFASLLTTPPRRCWITLSTNSLSNRLRLACRPRRARQQHRLFVAQELPQTKEEEQDEQEEEMSSDEESDTASINKDEVQETSPPDIHALLQTYKEAISSNDTSKIATIESQLLALQEGRDALGQQVAILTEEVSTGKERFLRLNADFDNFRKRSDRDKSAMTERVRGDVIESLLPMVDNFERAKAQIKVETEAEQRIDNSYQGIYKQFVEIMRGFGVSVVQTVGKEFDPNVHEAIMREESTEFEEGIVVQEFRRGFILNGRLLRPAMVKVSAGPGNVKPDIAGRSDAASQAVAADRSEAPSEAISVNGSEAPSEAAAVDSSEKFQPQVADVAESEVKPVS